MVMDDATRTTISQYYDGRAPTYDQGNNSMHVRLGLDYIKWSKPQQGEKVLDLACGTGLIALPEAEAVGSNGLVVGVDIAPEMMNLLHQKLANIPDEVKNSIAKMEIYESDITSSSLLDLPAIKNVVAEGGFDLISCCSCLPLLPDPAESIKLWATLLKKGGRMIVDTLTEDPNVHNLFTEMLRDKTGIDKNWDRAWIKRKSDLESAFKAAGMRVDQLFRTESMVEITTYDTNEQTGWRIFEDGLKKYPDFDKEHKVEEARKAWPQLWSEVTEGKEKYVDGAWLYVCIGVKQ